MASSIKDITVNQVGATIEILVVNTVKPNIPECFALTGVKSVIPTYNLGIGRSGIANPTTYPFTDQLIVTVNFHNEHANPPITFDIQTVTNQAGWTANFAGLAQAISDICGWVTSVAPGGGGGALALEATQLLVKAAVETLATGAVRALTTADHIGAGAQATTLGIKMAMITCVNGVETINGVIRPAGIYTFEPQKGEDTLAIISLNPNAGGRIIVDELS